MKRIFGTRALALLLAAALSSLALGGCMSQNNQATDAASQNRQYMTQVNQKMDDLSTRLDGFTDAVSRGDVVTMRTQADNAYKALDDLASLEAPEALSSAETAYRDGCAKLKEALDAYIDLYTEIASATDAQPFDYSMYDERVKSIQDAYDEGIAKLQEGDEAAAGN